MKIAIINKSDGTGGAAIVSLRLMEAFRANNIDAQMIVCEKLSDSPFVHLAASSALIKRKFIWERLKIFIENGFNLQTLFKIDTAQEGLSLWKHPIVKQADVILINWINQGMLSLNGLQKILQLDKPVIWTMHDMWPFTGICHHAGKCVHFHKECGDCPLLKPGNSKADLSHKIWKEKNKIFSNADLIRKMAFVPVSHWLEQKARESSLLKDKILKVIPNAFNLPSTPIKKIFPVKRKIRLLFGAARVDDPIKGLPTLIEASKILKKAYPEIADRLEIAIFGSIKNPASIEGLALPLINLGVLHGENQIRKAYEDAHIVVSASSYETLPGTLVEAQAYGCLPVSFNQGGQTDIIRNLSTGVIASYSEDPHERAINLSQAIITALSLLAFPDFSPEKTDALLEKMRQSVSQKFSYTSVVNQYLSLIQTLS